MTTNTVAYANYLETKRHNTSTEAETSAHNRATEEQAVNELAETTRSHKANEAYNLANLAEINRSNVAKERISSGQLQETKRSNKVNEAIKKASNKETIRTNKANERIKKASNVETKRSNKAKENILKKQNIETARHNLQNEQIDKSRIALTKLLETRKISETIRSNKVNEALRAFEAAVKKLDVDNTNTNNQAKVQLEYDKLKQTASENKKDRDNKELVAYINNAGQTLAKTGYLTMKGKPIADKATKTAKGVFKKIQKVVRDADNKAKENMKAAREKQREENSKLQNLPALRTPNVRKYKKGENNNGKKIIKG